MKEIENVKRKKHKKSLHEILTPKEETKSRIFTNREVNAFININININILLLGKMLFRKSKKTRRIYKKSNKSEKFKKPKNT